MGEFISLLTILISSIEELISLVHLVVTNSQFSEKEHPIKSLVFKNTLQLGGSIKIKEFALCVNKPLHASNLEGARTSLKRNSAKVVPFWLSPGLGGNQNFTELN